jgi:hypothetical protein
MALTLIVTVFAVAGSGVLAGETSAAVGPRAVRPLLPATALAVVRTVVPATRRQEGASDKGDLAARLMRLDPGARLGGNTQVATAAGARVLGVPRRVNFMVGLGPRQRIVGGLRHDQLGFRGAAGRIFGAAGPDLIHGGPGRDRLYGGRGDDLIYGGGGRDRLRGGPGRDRLIDGRGATTVRGTGSDRIDVADGRGDDRVLCAGGPIRRIELDRDDRIGPGCSGRLARLVYRRPEAAPLARAAQGPVAGDGSNLTPYTAPCDDPGLVDCTVSSFAARSLTGWWANEYVPAYRCPRDHRYLLDQGYAPFGTRLPRGIEVQGLGPIGVSITGWDTTTPPPGRVFPWVIGTTTGGVDSSATSWSFGTNSYRVILHCTSDPNHGYGDDRGAGPGP